MNVPRLFITLAFFALFLAACDETATPDTSADTTAVAPPAAQTLGANETPFASGQTSVPPVASASYCQNGGAILARNDEALAAKVNGQPIPLTLYQRQAAQAQVALVSQGLDPKTQDGQDEIKGLQQQVLAQLIDDLIVEQAARQENVSVSDQDVNNRVQQLINEDGGRQKFDDYLKANQLTMDDYCTQIRAFLFGQVMLDRVTAALPTKVEQIHAAHILLENQADATTVLNKLKAGGDFAALAKQYSKDEATRDNGGDLGWFPKGAMDPEFEAAAFQLKAGQTSGIISTQLGFHIIKVLERDPARELSPDILQLQKQKAFLAWLDARRSQAKIEKFVNP